MKFLAFWLIYLRVSKRTPWQHLSASPNICYASKSRLGLLWKNHLRPNEHSLLTNCFTVSLSRSTVFIILFLCFTVRNVLPCFQINYEGKMENSLHFARKPHYSLLINCIYSRCRSVFSVSSYTMNCKTISKSFIHFSFVLSFYVKYFLCVLWCL